MDESVVLKSIAWNEAGGRGPLIGTATVATPPKGAFAFFILGGLRFSITRSDPGGTALGFAYSGTRSAQSVKALFVPGAQLHLSR